MMAGVIDGTSDLPAEAPELFQAALCFFRWKLSGIRLRTKSENDAILFSPTEHVFNACMR
jgi:hypothetical protein